MRRRYFGFVSRLPGHLRTAGSPGDRDRKTEVAKQWHKRDRRSRQAGLIIAHRRAAPYRSESSCDKVLTPRLKGLLAGTWTRALCFATDICSTPQIGGEEKVIHRLRERLADFFLPSRAVIQPRCHQPATPLSSIRPAWILRIGSPWAALSPWSRDCVFIPLGGSRGPGLLTAQRNVEC